MNEAISESDTDGNAWIVALVVLCLGILGYGAIYSTESVSDPAFLAGQYSVYAIFIFGVFHAVFLRKRGGKINFSAFAAIYLALFAGGLVSASKQKQHAVQVVSSIQQEMSRIASATSDQNGFPARIERVAPQAPTASGELGEVERFMKEFMDRMVTQRNDYLLEIEAIGWGSILDAKRIKNDVALSESRVMIERVKAIVQKYEKKTAELMQGTRTHIESLNMSEASKKEMLAGFERGMDKSGKQIDEQWRLEKEVVGQFENIFLMLAASKTWVIEGERILFYSDDELARFNSYIQAIQDLTQHQEQLQKSSFAEANRKMESLKNAAQR